MTDDNFLHPGCVFFSKLDPHNTSIVIDTGASTSVSPFKDDFISFQESHSSVVGTGSKAKVEVHGVVRWTIFDSNDIETVVETETIYMPKATVRLYSPQAHFWKHQKGSMFVDYKGVKLLLPQQTTLFQFPFHEPSALPLMLHTNSRRGATSLYVRNEPLEPQCYALQEVFASRALTTSHDIDLVPTEHLEGNDILSTVVDERNVNLTGAQHELLSRTSIQTASMPCSTDGSLKDGHLRPGECVSMDQIVCPQRGLTVHSSKSTITGGTIFVDHASGYIKFTPQSSATVDATLVGKHTLEREAHALGFKVRSYLEDNGIFAAQQFLQDIRNWNHTIELSGVGTKHQNGIAENSVKTISGLARSMLIHATL